MHYSILSVLFLCVVHSVSAPPKKPLPKSRHFTFSARHIAKFAPTIKNPVFVQRGQVGSHLINFNPALADRSPTKLTVMIPKEEYLSIDDMLEMLSGAHFGKAGRYPDMMKIVKELHKFWSHFEKDEATGEMLQKLLKVVTFLIDLQILAPFKYEKKWVRPSRKSPRFVFPLKWHRWILEFDCHIRRYMAKLINNTHSKLPA